MEPKGLKPKKAKKEEANLLSKRRGHEGCGRIGKRTSVYLHRQGAHEKGRNLQRDEVAILGKR